MMQFLIQNLLDATDYKEPPKPPPKPKPVPRPPLDLSIALKCSKCLKLKTPGNFALHARHRETRTCATCYRKARAAKLKQLERI